MMRETTEMKIADPARIRSRKGRCGERVSEIRVDHVVAEE